MLTCNVHICIPYLTSNPTEFLFVSFIWRLMTPYGDLAVKAVTASYDCNWHLRPSLFAKENDKDLAVKAVTGSYEGYWHLILYLFKKIFGHHNLPEQ